MLKLRRLLGSKEPSPVSNGHVVPFNAALESTEDVVETPVIDVRARTTESPTSSSTHLDAKAEKELPSLPPPRKASLPRHVDIKSAPRTPPSVQQMSSTSSLSVKRITSNQSSASDHRAERKASKSNSSIDKQINGRESVASRRSNSASAVVKQPRGGTAWSSDDTFLPRAKPPPPLVMKHRRNGSTSNGPTPAPSPPSSSKRRRPATSHETSSHRKLSKQPQRDPNPQPNPPIVPTASAPTAPPAPTAPTAPTLRPPRPLSLSRSNSMRDMSLRPRSVIHRQSNSHSNVPAPDTRPGSARTINSTSLESELSDKSLAPDTFSSAWKWTPPASWAGPPGSPPADRDEGEKPIVRSKLVRVNSAKGSLNRHVHARPNLPPQAMWRPQSRLAEVGTPDEGSASEEGRVSPDVVVKIQRPESDHWHERAMADVIPQLRALKSR